MESTLSGIPVSPGIAIGPALPYQMNSVDVARVPVEDLEGERERLDRAFNEVREVLTEIRDRTEEAMGPSHAAIFDGQLAMLDDVAFRPEIERRLDEEHVAVEYLVDDIIKGYTKMMAEVDDEQFRDRSMDFVDVGRRILGSLANVKVDALDHLEHPSIVLARNLTPSETVNMDVTNTLGMAIDGGGPTSHMAILARAMDIPAVVGLHFIGTSVSTGDLIIVDGTHGRVIVRPEPETLDDYEEARSRYIAARKALRKSQTEGPCLTEDGTRIFTFANIELPSETESAKRAQCDGIGLYRTEYLFMNRSSLPTEEEQFQAYRRVVETMKPAPVTMRTLDVGGDKLIAHLHRQPETNPQLGWRSMRFCLDRPDIFKAQLRALFRASVFGNLQIMFPMISGVDMMRESLRLVEEVKYDLRARGVKHNPDLPVGAMIEVPAAVMVADKLATECAFFSVGTNDLIQYCLAVDRANDRIAEMYEPCHPGVLQLLKDTQRAAAKAGIPCTICGEMAGDPMLVQALLGLGYERLSMSAVALASVRAEIAQTHVSKAKYFAQKLLRTGSTSEIRTLLQQRFEGRASPLR